MSDHMLGRALSYVAMFILIVGCSTSAKGLMASTAVDKPAVKVNAVAIRSLSFNEVGIDVELTINNPNDFDFDIEGVDYIVKVSGNELLEGEHRQKVAVPAEGSALLTVPLSLNFMSLTQAMSSMTEINSFGYELETLTYVRLPIFGLVSIPATHDGTLKLSDVLRIPM